MPETKIYENSIKIGEIPEDGIKTIKIKKSLSDKILIAKKEGYKNTPIKLKTTFNPVSAINFLSIFAWTIDLVTEKCCKWDTDVVEIEIDKKETEK